MNLAIRRNFFLFLTAATMALAATGVHAQYSDYFRLHGGSIALGGTGQFTKQLNTNAASGTFTVPTRTSTTTTTVSNQQQFTTDSAGFVVQSSFHPVAWAGVELNYGFTHYTEGFAFNYSNATATQRVNVPTDMHEFTGAYTFHPPHIPLQPFVSIGGGALDFTPRNASNQWRGAGLLEAGLDLPTRNKHLAFRVEGRSLYARAPNFYTPAISTASWRVTIEPMFASVYRF